MKGKAIIICLALSMFFLLRISYVAAGDTFYDAGGRRIGTTKQTQGKKNYYDSGGKLLGWSKRSGEKYRYYDKDGKFLGYSGKEDGRIYFYSR